MDIRETKYDHAVNCGLNTLNNIDTIKTILSKSTVKCDMANIDINNQALSLSLYDYLCKVVGSDDVVKTRRNIYNAMNYVSTSSYFTLIKSGSKAEGLDLRGSDLDIMMVWDPVHVYESIDDIPKDKQKVNKMPLIMDTNDTKPGYTQLRLLDSDHKDIPGLGDVCYKGTYISSKLVREKNMEEGYVEHGPCTSAPDGSFDSVISFYSDRWISQAGEWIRRSRSSWPDNRLIENIVQYGVLFVPVGSKNSPRRDLEFHISFNVAEKILVHSFSHVQLLCYTLLKIILNHFIKPRYDALLCSYFLKTIMFWVSEESVESIWRPNNLLLCFDRCFKRLVYCVTYSTCLHYFIPELDFFEDRFSKYEHDSLTCTLRNLYNSGWQCLLQTKLLNHFNYLNQLTARAVPSVSALSSSLFYDDLNTVYASKILNKSVFGALNKPGKQMYVISLSYVNQVIAQSILMNETFRTTNKQIYRHYRKCLNHLLQGFHHDAVSGWLLLASFFYTRKQYQQCLHVLNYCLHKCTPDKILLKLNIDTDLQHEFNMEIEQHVKNGFLAACKRRVINMVLFFEPSFIIPEELSSLILDKLKRFPPVVFAHFLHCICLHRLNRYREKMNALYDLETTVREMYFVPHSEKAIDTCYTCIYIARQLTTE